MGTCFQNGAIFVLGKGPLLVNMGPLLVWPYRIAPSAVQLPECAYLSITYRYLPATTNANCPTSLPPPAVLAAAVCHFILPPLLASPTASIPTRDRARTMGSNNRQVDVELKRAEAEQASKCPLIELGESCVNLYPSSQSPSPKANSKEYTAR